MTTKLKSLVLENDFTRMWKSMSNEKRAAYLNDALMSGKTVTISTQLKAWRMTKKHLLNFRKSGYEIFKGNKSGLYMARGKKWDDINFAKIEID